MTNVIVAFSRPEDAKSIKKILMRSGFQVIAICNSGAQVLSMVNDMSHGIVVCGYQLADMLFSELYECMSREISMLMIASPSKWTAHMTEEIVCLPMPLKVHDLVDTLRMIEMSQEKLRKRLRLHPRQRSEEEKKLITQAKSLLMERNSMTEDEAHCYIQKCSMDNGTNLIETARMVMSLIHH